MNWITTIGYTLVCAAAFCLCACENDMDKIVLSDTANTAVVPSASNCPNNRQMYKINGSKYAFYSKKAFFNRANWLFWPAGRGSTLF